MDWQDGGDGFDFQDKLACGHDIRLEAVADTRALIEDGIVTCRAKAIPASANSRHKHSSYLAALICEFQLSSATSVYLGYQPDHPICERFRKTHNALSVNTVLSALTPC